MGHKHTYIKGLPETEKDTATDYDGTPLDTNGQILVWDEDNKDFDAEDMFPISGHYTGFPNRTDTSINFDDGTYTLTLTATNDKIWINGVSYLINTLTKQLTVAQEAVTGLYWFWITAPLGVPQLNCDISAPGFDKCLVATVYWNTTKSKGIKSDERHWMGRDKWMHEYLHETIGARYATGLAGTFTNTTVTIALGEFYDEDIEHEISEQTTVKVLYHNGDADWDWDVLATPYKVVNPGVDDNLRYNDGNALATVDNNKYVNYWVYITGDIDHPVHIFLDTAQYTTLTLARAAGVPNLGSMASAETKLIYKVIYQNNGGTPDYKETIDYRASSNLPTASYVPIDHGTLAGLSDVDHPASAIANTPAGDIAATTVQAAINELDSEKLPKTNFGIRYSEIAVVDFTTDVATGDGKAYFVVPPALNGMNLVSVHARVITAGITGTMDIQIRNVTDSQDMLSTKITIDSTEVGSDTAATPAVIDTSYDDVASYDLIAVDVDAVQTTKAKGCIITLGFSLP